MINTKSLSEKLISFAEKKKKMKREAQSRVSCPRVTYVKQQKTKKNLIKKTNANILKEKQTIGQSFKESNSLVMN